MGEARAEQWAKGIVTNMARPPSGGDTDQIKAVAAGECGVAVTNTYYWVRLLRSSDPKDQDSRQQGWIHLAESVECGAHVNICRRWSREERAEQGERDCISRISVKSLRRRRYFRQR